MNREDEEMDVRVTWVRKRQPGNGKRPDENTEIEKTREPTSRWDTKWNRRTSNTEIEQEKYKYSYHECAEN